MKQWLMAFRPKTLTAAIVPVMVGTALAQATDGVINWTVTICALGGALFIQVATNLFNDALDHKKGTDTTERIGPTRVSASGLISFNRIILAGIVCLFIAVGFGIPLVLKGGLPIIILGLVCLFFAYGYTGGPFPLSYLGLGDLFVLLFFGLAAVTGTHYLQTERLDMWAVILGIQVGLLATVLIVINNMRDVATDSKVNKKTLAVRLGTRFSRVELTLLIVGAFSLNFAWLFQGWIWAAALPFASFPLAVILLLGVYKNDPEPIYNSFLAKAAALQLIFGVLLTAGLYLA